ncbi:ABC transporter substrate-binding protein [Longispora albida]|uniref:ABC transporter substrate-binding protein n=1 Tax=Longispora albida TaxID=203523 RepID=UPI0003A42D51|nr:ABC transporter substrate-binding protein [Longispora albida]
MQRSRLRTAIALTAIAALAVGAAGCAESKREESKGDKSKDKTLIFGTAGEPKVLDPSLATDGETYRVPRQVLETLIGNELGSAKLVPRLAEKWSVNAEGTVWTFNLREKVKFHDDTDFNAEAVCANFDRWHNYSGLFQNVAEYWLDTFGGFAKNESATAPASNYKGCKATDAKTAVLTLNKSTSRLPGAFTLPAFSIQSPKAIAAYASDKMEGTAANLTYPKYALEKMVGTGPFKLDGWDRANKRVTMSRYDGYWGDKAKIAKLVFRAIPDENARRQALEANEIQGYDLVAPADVPKLKEAKFNVPARDPFNVLYLGIGQDNPKLADVRVRQAIAYAVDREALVKSKLPAGAKVADQFMPDSVEGYSPDVKKYPRDVNKAKSLLAEAGATGLEVKFYYPTEVTRPYMPSPKDIFEIVKGGLEEAGFKVTPVPEKWSPTYLDDVRAGKPDLWLLGWTGDYNEGYNFAGTFFGRPKAEWGFNNAEIFGALAKVDAEPDRDKRIAQYKEINKQLMEFLPGLPLSSSPPSLAFAKNVTGVKASPLTDEKFFTAEFTS